MPNNHNWGPHIPKTSLDSKSAAAKASLPGSRVQHELISSFWILHPGPFREHMLNVVFCCIFMYFFKCIFNYFHVFFVNCNTQTSICASHSNTTHSRGSRTQHNLMLWFHRESLTWPSAPNIASHSYFTWAVSLEAKHLRKPQNPHKRFAMLSTVNICGIYYIYIYIHWHWYRCRYSKLSV